MGDSCPCSNIINHRFQSHQRTPNKGGITGQRATQYPADAITGAWRVLPRQARNQGSARRWHASLSSQASCAAAFASCGSWGPISNRQSVPVAVDSMQCTLACMHSSPLEDTTVTLYCTVPFSAVTDRLKAVLQLHTVARMITEASIPLQCHITCTNSCTPRTVYRYF